MGKVIRVGMADLGIAKCPDSLLTAGLGSCVGVCLYDSVAKVGGLAHIMLPDSNSARSKENPAKFADTAIPLTIEKMSKEGAVKKRIVAKIAGGAQMFSFSNGSDIMKIGERNINAVKRILKELGIALVAESTGGNYGRTIELKTDTGILTIRTIDHGTWEI
ncbi:MAG TPA: chemotaxis protein CheD [Clostridia bacterium]|jgi:chemotaxis protein CheD|nr:chemotaxis protein CheD [Clostridia bacterium]